MSFLFLQTEIADLDARAPQQMLRLATNAVKIISVFLDSVSVRKIQRTVLAPLRQSAPSVRFHPTAPRVNATNRLGSALRSRAT